MKKELKKNGNFLLMRCFFLFVVAIFHFIPCRCCLQWFHSEKWNYLLMLCRWLYFRLFKVLGTRRGDFSTPTRADESSKICGNFQPNIEHAIRIMKNAQRGHRKKVSNSRHKLQFLMLSKHNKTAATFQQNMLEHTIERRHSIMNIGAVDKIYHSAENMQDNLLANLPSSERKWRIIEWKTVENRNRFRKHFVSFSTQPMTRYTRSYGRQKW